MIARRGLRFEYERVSKPLVKGFIMKKEGFLKLNNWKQWSAMKKSVIAELKNIPRKG